MANYVGVLDGGGKAWGVRVPDLPGCHGGGKSAEAAIGDALSAAREWLSLRSRQDAAAPKPRTVAEIIRDGELDSNGNEAAVILNVALDAGRTVRANLTFDAGLLEAIDAEAGRLGLTRSAFIASAARERLGAV